MPRSVTRKTGRKPLTREMLLPLPVAKFRAVSLENHLALVAMRTGNGNVDQMSCLLKTVYLAWFMHDGATGDDRGLFRDAESALECSATRAERGDGWTFSDGDSAAVERVLAVHDGQLASMPSHRYTAAWERLQRFITSDARSPFPALETA